MIVDPPEHPIAMLGLGGSVATPPTGLEADVLVVKSFQDLDATRRRGQGQDRALQRALHQLRRDGAVPLGRGRGRGPARRGGGVRPRRRADGPAHAAHRQHELRRRRRRRFPTAAIAAEDANRIQRLTDRGLRVRVRLQMEAHFEPDVRSANVFGEIVGRELPNEIVLVGCHFDSWDVGTGASDNGVGCIVTWEALRLMKSLGLQPRRTVRLGLFTNEENGLRGGTAYRDAHKASAGDHVFALESDSGRLRAVPARLHRLRRRARRSSPTSARCSRPLGHGRHRPGRRRRRHRPDRRRPATCR